MIYFDNAATSWPKPPEVSEAMVAFLRDVGASPGRSGHRLAIEAGRIVYRAREAIAELFHAPDPLQVVWTHNVTEALNLVLRGFLGPGDHLITSSMEHNSVMRPVRALQHQGLEVSVIPCSAAGDLDPEAVEAAVQANTVMIAVNHGSNVVGTIQPAAEIGRIARRHNLLCLLDTAQTAGASPIDMQQDCIDMVAFTGHKSLYGPTGTGGLVIGERVDIERFQPLKRGGTGSRSEHEEHPGFLPDRFESGTMNTVGLAGLAAAVRWLMKRGIEPIRTHEVKLTRQLLDGLAEISGVTIYGGRNAEQQTSVVSFNIDGLEPSDIGLRLDEEFEIMCRVGLHCAPSAHKTIGTFPNGTVRFGFGAFTTSAEVEAALSAVKTLANEA